MKWHCACIKGTTFMTSSSHGMASERNLSCFFESCLDRSRNIGNKVSEIILWSHVWLFSFPLWTTSSRLYRFVSDNLLWYAHNAAFKNPQVLCMSMTLVRIARVMVIDIFVGHTAGPKVTGRGNQVLYQHLYHLILYNLSHVYCNGVYIDM